ncbi:hypothetical protein Ga0061065_10786 [Marinomonas fungiae]|uniref:Uncharacterized protein n=1 Tax=Marinomonas fungiae TaxID=1137284 RepID=A0A0K6IN34_9GAMM|nr:hypothetical protein Ga0061065_10786 [Marinomonas fungiae]
MKITFDLVNCCLYINQQLESLSFYISLRRVIKSSPSSCKI